MDLVADSLNETFRWVTPVAGLAITLLAWRRFKSPGIRLTVLGFSLMLVSPVVRLVIDRVWLDRGDLTATDIATLLYVSGLASAVGMVVVVLSMRKLINSAVAQDENSTLPEQDGMR